MAFLLPQQLRKLRLILCLDRHILRSQGRDELVLVAGVANYLNSKVDFTAVTDWTAFYNTIGFAPSLTASGQIVGLGAATGDSPTSYAPFVMTIPEPASLTALLGGVSLLISRRRRA